MFVFVCVYVYVHVCVCIVFPRDYFLLCFVWHICVAIHLTAMTLSGIQQLIQILKMHFSVICSTLITISVLKTYPHCDQNIALGEQSGM